MTLDWPEFRDILFPLITGRYTERHIRKLFELFDTTQDGYLSLQEISGKDANISFFPSLKKPTADIPFRVTSSSSCQ